MSRVICFKPRFVELVRDGRKRHTMRLRSTTTPKPGDTRSLRTWTGRPYASPQEVLIPEVMIRRVEDLKIWLAKGVLYARSTSLGLMTHDQMRAFARADGFTDLVDMMTWMRENSALPFDGVLIHW